MLEAQIQQHLRTLRRTLNRAVTSLKDDGRVICHSGWGYGSCYSHPWLEGKGQDEIEFPQDSKAFLLLPPPDAESCETWWNIFPAELQQALEFFWPGPLQVQVRLKCRSRITVCTPWTPLMKELLSRHGAVLWEPLEAAQAQALEEGKELSESQRDGGRVLLWPEKEARICPTFLDVSTRPWRLLGEGFVSSDELQSKLTEPVVLSLERAFPARPIRTYVPDGKTIVLEAQSKDQLPAAVECLRGQVPPDAYVRIYLDEHTAHNHFPDDREVRVYGELSDPERVRRRLQAMLERQNRRFGKRILLIAVADIGQADSFRADLEKLSDGWLNIEEGVDPVLDAV